MDFDHSYFDHYDFEHVPLDRDIYLMDEIWIEAYNAAMRSLFDGRGYDTVGYISYAAARNIDHDVIELSWYPNFHDRFHEMRVYLPRDQFVCCVGSWRYDEKPRIFVRSNWLANLHLRSNSIFALVDAIGAKEAIRRGTFTREVLIRLRDRIDAVASDHPSLSFVSFADSLLLKSNWQVGQYDSAVRYTYQPEIFLHVFQELQTAYRQCLGMAIYAVLTQGSNAYYDDALLHVSTGGNHISLNSLGLPFAQLLSIERTARAAVGQRIDEPAELYIDSTFFRSIRFAFKFDRDAVAHNAYREPLMGEDGIYYYAACRHLLDNLADK
jgi:hypothetical protein